MAKIHIEREHRLDPEEARARLETLARSLTEELDADCRLEDGRLDLERPGASGTVAVDAERVVVEVRLGLLLAVGRRSIERAIEERLDRFLGPSET